MKEIYLHCGNVRDYNAETVLHVDVEDLPDEYIIPQMPDVLDQGDTWMCGAHAIAEAMQVAFFNKTGLKLDFSVLMIYALWRKEGFTGKGMRMSDSINIGRNIGTLERRYAPDVMDVPEAISKAEEYGQEHSNKMRYTIGNWFKILKNARFEDNLKRALYEYQIPLPIATDYSSGYHAEVIVGWKKDGKFVVQDSYGPKKWTNGLHNVSAINKIKEAYLIFMDEMKVPFKDIENHWSKDYVEKMYFAGLINGKTPTEFCPEDNLKRGEMAALLCRQAEKYDNIINELEEKIEKLEGKK